eukprot:8264199-Pyramimonas_sp.AAC.1
MKVTATLTVHYRANIIGQSRPNFSTTMLHVREAAPSKLAISREKMERPELVSTVQKEIRNAEPGDWKEDVNTQYHSMATTIKDAARAVFAKDMLTPHQEYISRNTMQRFVNTARRAWNREEHQPYRNLCRYLPFQFGLFAREGDPWLQEPEHLLLRVTLHREGCWSDVELIAQAEVLLRNAATFPMRD